MAKGEDMVAGGGAAVELCWKPWVGWWAFDSDRSLVCVDGKCRRARWGEGGTGGCVRARGRSCGIRR